MYSVIKNTCAISEGSKISDLRGYYPLTERVTSIIYKSSSDKLNNAVKEELNGKGLDSKQKGE